MAGKRLGTQLLRSSRILPSLEHNSVAQRSHCLRNFATASTIPVTQNVAGSKGPTAIVFLNMGGPSTTDEVGDFLSRLFVCLIHPS
jgi:protoporphyrin/coproporphyrin ferrochelatase